MTSERNIEMGKIKIGNFEKPLSITINKIPQEHQAQFLQGAAVSVNYYVQDIYNYRDPENIKNIAKITAKVICSTSSTTLMMGVLNEIVLESFDGKQEKISKNDNLSFRFT